LTQITDPKQHKTQLQKKKDSRSDFVQIIENAGIGERGKENFVSNLIARTLDVIFFSAAKTTPSAARMPTAAPA
jgi:hypothetical protein